MPITFKEIKKLAIEVKDRCGRAEAVGLIRDVGKAEMLRDIPEENYAAFKTACEERLK